MISHQLVIETYLFRAILVDILPGMQDKRAILAATLVRIRVASSRGGGTIAGDPFGHNECLCNQYKQTNGSHLSHLIN